jgi:hypothetical protein
MIDTLTWDRGTEMAAHKRFTVATDVRVYFCDPKIPWQRATSENTNRLLRQYLPRKSDLSVYDQHDLDLIAPKAQHPTPQDPSLQHPGCYTGTDRCAYRLNPPLLFGGSPALDGEPYSLYEACGVPLAPRCSGPLALRRRSRTA